MRAIEILDMAGRLLTTTSSHVVLLSASLPLSFLAYFTRNSGAANLIPILASIASLTTVEYGKLSYMQLFYLMLISGAIPRQFNSLKIAISLLIALPLSLATATSGRLSTALSTLLLSALLCVVLLTYYMRKVKESGSVTIV